MCGNVYRREQEGTLGGYSSTRSPYPMAAYNQSQTEDSTTGMPTVCAFYFISFLCLQLELGIEVSVPCSSMHGVEFMTFVCRICPSGYTMKRDLMTVLILYQNCAISTSQELKMRSSFFVSSLFPSYDDRSLHSFETRTRYEPR